MQLREPSPNQTQTLYDRIVAHLREQGGPSMTPQGMCCYRSPDGLKCAVGCLIDDEHYQVRLEGAPLAFPQDYRWQDLVEAIQGSLGEKLTALSLTVLTALQRTHDNRNHCDWEGRFNFIASEYKLKYTPPEPKEVEGNVVT